MSRPSPQSLSAKWISAYLDGTINDDDFAKLSAYLRESPAHLEELAAAAQLDEMVRDTLAQVDHVDLLADEAVFAQTTSAAQETVDDLALGDFASAESTHTSILALMADLEPSDDEIELVDLTQVLRDRKLAKHLKLAAANRGLQIPKKDRPTQQYVIPKLVAGLATAAVIGLMVWLGLDKTPTTQDASFTDGTDSSMAETETPPVTPPAIVATIRDSVDAQWIGQDDPNDFLREGQVVTLSSGFAEIVFGSGATMIVEGPATFEMIDANAFSLTRGRIAATVPELAKGFEVRTPAGVVTDYGTEFGIEVHDAQTTDVQVFRGEVRVARLENNNTHGSQAAVEQQTLLAGDAGRIDTQASRIRVGVARPSSFVRSMDQVAADRRIIFSDFESAGSRFRASDGEGWLGPWQVLERNCRVSLQTESQEPMGWDSNRYLKATMDGVPGGASSATLMRSYGNFGEIDLSQPHVIRFSFRLDQPMERAQHINEKIAIFDGVDGTVGSSGENTWSLHAYPDGRSNIPVPSHTWVVYDGDGRTFSQASADYSRLLDTRVPLVAGTTYEIEITVRPAQSQWDIVIVHDGERYSSLESLGRSLKFRQSTGRVFGNLNFNTWVDSDHQRVMSIDDVRIESIRDSDALERRQ